MKEPGQIWYKTLTDSEFKDYFDPEVQRFQQLVDKNIKTAFKLFANLTIKLSLPVYQFLVLPSAL